MPPISSTPKNNKTDVSIATVSAARSIGSPFGEKDWYRGINLRKTMRSRAAAMNAHA